jgi:hypothetical protein
MKEQTPITAEAIARSFLDPCIVNPTEIKDLEKYIEQYAQSKVLEALEREVPKAFYKGANQHRINCIPIYETEVEEINRFNLESKYYETEVEPRYK